MNGEIEALTTIIEALPGAMLFGLGVAVWITKRKHETWERWERMTVGVGIGAATSYVVGWIDVGKQAALTALN